MTFKSSTDEDIDQYFVTAQPIKFSRSEKKLEYDNVENWVNACLSSEEVRKQVWEEARRLQGESIAMVYSTNSANAQQYGAWITTSGNTWPMQEDHTYFPYPPFPQPHTPYNNPLPSPSIDWSKLQWTINNPPQVVTQPKKTEENLMRLFQAYVVKVTKEDKKKTTYDVVLSDTLIAKDREAALLKVGQMIADKTNDDDILHTSVSEVFSFPA